MTLCYIAGPYASPTAEERERNIARAVLLGRLACESGLVPIVPHALGAAGVFGAADEGDGCRERAIKCGEALARSVAEAGGVIWVIAHAVQGLSGTTARSSTTKYQLSSGTEREVRAYHEQSCQPTIRCRSWADWAEIFDELRLPPHHDLRTKYEALR